MLSKLKGVIALTGGHAFFVPVGFVLNESKGNIMKELTADKVNRRGFLAKAMAASAAVVVPIALARPSEMAEMAKALHEAVSQFDDEYGPSHVQVCNDGQSLNLAMDALHDSSVEDIEELLLPLFGGVA